MVWLYGKYEEVVEAKLDVVVVCGRSDEPKKHEPDYDDDEEEEILGSDDDEQEDPRDYCKGETDTDVSLFPINPLPPCPFLRY